MSKTARLFWTDTERDADLLYLSGFHAGDPILYIEQDGKSALYLNDLEVESGELSHAGPLEIRLPREMSNLYV